MDFHRPLDVRYFSDFFNATFCRAQVAVLNPRYKLAAISARSNDAVSKRFSTCLKLEDKFTGSTSTSTFISSVKIHKTSHNYNKTKNTN